MKPIVLATDGSPSAAEATLHAVELADAFDAPLVVVAVEHVDVPSYGYYGYADLVTEMTKIERAHVEETLAQAKAVATEADVPCEVVHAIGPTAEAICTAARRHNAQLIVIGAHGWGALGRIWHGSVSTAVLHEAHCPVLVVRGGPEVMLEPGAAQDQAVVVSRLHPRRTGMTSETTGSER
jgi:nucleotide-binding universal stress UspA family protein